jgi:hypothetical protein
MRIVVRTPRRIAPARLSNERICGYSKNIFAIEK